jgi:hypothetical protein
MWMYNIYKSAIMNQPQNTNPNLQSLLNLNPIDIQGFSRDVTNQYIGMSLCLTP